MCFSPEASFAAGGALVPVGVYCLRAAWKKSPRLLPLAAVPVLLAVQQVSEGCVWIALLRDDPDAVRLPALVFLFFAFAFWPFWFPVVAAAGETRPARRLWLAGFAILASGWFWVLYYPVLVDPADRLTVSVAHHSIRYSTSLPVDGGVSRTVVRVFYLLSMAVPLTIGPKLVGPLPGLLLAASAAVAAVVFEYAFASVWCFFAAVLGLSISWVFYRMPGREPVAGRAAQFA